MKYEDCAKRCHQDTVDQEEYQADTELPEPIAIRPTSETIMYRTEWQSRPISLKIV